MSLSLRLLVNKTHKTVKVSKRRSIAVAGLNRRGRVVLQTRSVAPMRAVELG